MKFLEKLFRRKSSIPTIGRKNKNVKRNIYIVGAVLIGIVVTKLLISPAKTVKADTIIKFDEGYGTSSAAHDSNNTVAAGTITGATWEPEEFCKVGKCLYLDGSGDSVSFADDSNLDMAATDNVTVEGWFRAAPSSSTMPLISKNLAGDTPADGGYTISLLSSGAVKFGIDNDNTSFPLYAATSTPGFNDNKWHHFAAVKNGTTSISIYVDGNLGQTTAITSTDASNNETFYIGLDQLTALNYTGFIDEVSVLRTARTADQVKADYTGTNVGNNGNSSIIGTSASFGDDQSYLSNGLVGYWKMDENTGTTNTDTSGNGITLTFTNSPTWGTGKFGSGVTMNGSNSYLTTTSSKDVLQMRRRSLSAFMWVKAAKTASPDRILIFNGAGNASSAGYILQPDHTTGVLQMWVSDGSAYIVNSLIGTTDILDSTWHHVGFTWNPNEGAKLFVDGKLDASVNVTTTADINYTSTATQIGGFSTSTFTTNGTLDDVRFYNRALPTSDIQKIYNWAPSPVLSFDMDEEGGNVIHDRASGITGTAYNGATFGSGKFGAAGVLDGTNDFFDLGQINTTTNFGSTKSLTASAWIYINSMATDSAIISHQSSYSANNPGWDLYLFNSPSGGGDMCAYVDDGITNHSEACTGNLAGTIENHWEYWTMTFDRASRVVSLYRNGILQNTTNNVASAMGSIDGTNFCARLGANATSTLPCVGTATSAYMNGKIDDVKVYDYVRSTQQVTEDMNGGHPAPGSPVGSAVGQWHFDEGQSDTINNVGNCGATCNLTRAGSTKPSWSNNGKMYKALSYGGSNAYLAAGSDISQFKITGSITLSAWINLTNISSTHDIICKYTGTASSSSYCLRTNTSGNLQLLIVNSTGPAIVTTTGNTTLATGTWYHVAGVFTSANNVSLYVNGVLDKYNTTSIPTTLQDSTTILDVGGENAGSNLMNGIIDEAAIYNSALTSDQIDIIYNQGRATVMGALSTDTSGKPSWSARDSYCPPGNIETKCAAGQDPSPIGEWHLDEGSGKTAYDTSGNGLTGNLNNGPVWASGKIGQAVAFNPTSGGTQNISIADAGGTLQATTMTIEAWVNLKSLSPSSVLGSDTNESYIVARGNASDIPYSISYGNDGSSGFEFCVAHDGSTQGCAISGVVASINTWYHIVGTWSQPTVNIYVNGAFKNSATLSNTMSTLASSGYIGRSGQSVYDGYLSGIVDNVTIYNYVRTQSQLSWDYNHGGPVGWWKLDDGSGSLAKDASGNGLNANITIGGSGTQTTTTQAWTNGASGKINGSLNFDGNDDYALVTDSSASGPLNGIQSQYTISTWLYMSSQPSGTVNLIGKNTTAGWAYALEIDGANGNGIGCSMWNGGSGSGVGNFYLQLNTWYHITCTYNDSTNTMKFYVNGVLKDTNAADTITPQTSTTAVALGGYWDGATASEFFPGKMDDVKIYNYEMNATQVANMYNGSAAVTFKQ